MNQYPSIVILTGAGISAESGIQTFRAADGLWHNHRIEEVATPEGFAANPALVHEFYNARRRQLHDPAVQPNAAHLALARLEQEYPGEVLLVTQNVDDLHERAGSTNLIHMHGELGKIRCQHSGQVYGWTDDLDTRTVCECCGKPGNLRPHIVWFGEMPLLMEDIYAALEECDLFLSIGTSGQVYPAAGFVEVAREAGSRTVELNLDPSNNSARFDKSFNGPATQVVPMFVERLLE
ncbi:Sir2 family NAD+-dependent deacetylase [Candidatus Thiothrix sp. Deng01]|uniref:NAD-dependent protein deacylase n=1 Tax=Candidatus Thiothrix phosphatis TaxID=3112415 RepID=A0ABU6D0J8_9GAMM|nr:Sir2 family NAD+-dependent deacetylase [Candidatus Thiothrix sp. Deng01]MEB4592602.1 Sir2 family NAD+-dependent deacetylase [Candidatus Thiothrix sp. Deng01]